MADHPKFNLSHWLQNKIFRLFLVVLLALPYRTRLKVAGWFIARVVSPIAGYKRRIRDNLQLVLPNLSEEEVAQILREVPDNIGRSLIEMYSPREFLARTQNLPLQGEGAAALEAAFERKQPVILVTAHMGNYQATRAALIGRGYPLGALYMNMSNPYFNEHYVAALRSFGETIFPRGRAGMAGMVKFLRQGGMLGMLTDQHMKSGKLLGFFGHEALTALSAAELALKYDALLVPIYALRKEDGENFDIVIEAPIPHSDPVTMTQSLNDSLEAVVRAHLGQWFWIHKRWKGGGAKVD